MRWNRARICILTAACIAAIPAAWGQEKPLPEVEAEAALRAELAALTRSVARIAALLEEHLKRQQADLLMQRIQLASRGLTDLEQRVSRAKEERDSLERERRLMNDEIARLEIAEGEDPPAGIPQTEEDRKALRMNLDREVRRITEGLAGVEGLLAVLESELAVRLEELEAWEELVDKALGLR